MRGADVITCVRFGLSWAGAVLLIATSASAQPAVSISTWQSTNGTGIRFVPLRAEVVTAEPKGGLSDETSGGGFQYAVDTSSLSWGADCTCYRYYVIFARSRATNVITKHKFRGIPSGSFDDQRVQVRLAIQEGDRTHTDDITLPVASAPGLEPSLVVVKTEHNPEGLSLGGVTEIQVTLVNPNKHVSIEIPSEIVVIPTATQLWKTAPTITGGQYPIRLGPTRTKVMTLRLEPYVSQALGAAFPPTRAGTPHTAVHLDVPYANPLFADRVNSVPFEVPLRFQPGALALVFWLTVGVLLGSLIPLASGGKASLKRWPRAASAALVAGVIFELFGILAVQNNSKFMLFGFDFDPWQSLSVLILGVMMGLLGLGAAKRLQAFIDKRGEEANAH
jgi:hypothetical protein